MNLDNAVISLKIESKLVLRKLDYLVLRILWSMALNNPLRIQKTDLVTFSRHNSS